MKSVKQDLAAVCCQIPPMFDLHHMQILFQVNERKSHTGVLRLEVEVGASGWRRVEVCWEFAEVSTSQNGSALNSNRFTLKVVGLRHLLLSKLGILQHLLIVRHTNSIQQHTISDRSF